MEHQQQPPLEIGPEGSLVATAWVQERRRPSTPVPPEFMGRARLLRDKIRREDVEFFPKLRSVSDKIWQRAKTNPIPRRADLQEWVYRWQRMPSSNRMMLLDARIDGLSCSAIDIQLCAVEQMHQNWGDDCAPEPAVGIVAFSHWFTPAKLSPGKVTSRKRPKPARVAIAPSTYEKLQQVRCSVSFHALARSYQRWQNIDWRHAFRPPTDTDIMAAMIPLAVLRTQEELAELADANGRFRIEAAAGLGAWYGELVMDPSRKNAMLCVRTYKGPDT